MRVSKADGSQVLDLQKDALIEAGISQDRIYQDLASGRFDDRPGLNECIKALQPGNTLVVWKLDRLGRSLKHLVNTVEELKQKEVGLKVLTGQGAQIDTSTPHGKLVFGMFAALAEFNVSLLLRELKQAYKLLALRGRMGGRPRKMDHTTLKLAMTAMSDKGSIAQDVAKRLNITTTTLYAYLNGDGSLKALGKKLIDS